MGKDSQYRVTCFLQFLIVSLLLCTSALANPTIPELGFREIFLTAFLSLLAEVLAVSLMLRWLGSRFCPSLRFVAIINAATYSVFGSYLTFYGDLTDRHLLLECAITAIEAGALFVYLRRTGGGRPAGDLTKSIALSLLGNLLSLVLGVLIGGWFIDLAAPNFEAN